MKSSISISIEYSLLNEVNEILSNIGLDIETAINIYLKRIQMEKKIPFDLNEDIPNELTLKAFDECVAMREDEESYKRYNSFSDVLNDII